jgi:hypothetical protein
MLLEFLQAQLFQMPIVVESTCAINVRCCIPLPFFRVLDIL